MEKFSSIERVVGKIPDTEKKELTDLMGDVFHDQSPERMQSLSEITRQYEDVYGIEREKTSDEKRIITLVDHATRELSRRYGVGELSIPEKNIHFLRKNPFPQIQELGGFYHPTHQMVVLPANQKGNIHLMHNLFHEMTHFKSYAALSVPDPEKKEYDLYRLGLRVHSRKDDGKVYFDNLNEAITEMLTNSLSAELLDDPLFFEERREMREALGSVTGQVREDVYFAKRYTDETGELKTTMDISPYKQERDVSALLCKKAYERNTQHFENEEAVFDVFARAMITGNILPLGKLIEQTFERGTFRKIGELGNDTDALEKLVGEL